MLSSVSRSLSVWPYDHTIYRMHKPGHAVGSRTQITAVLNHYIKTADVKPLHVYSALSDT